MKINMFRTRDPVFEDYPLGGIVLILLLILLAPFVSAYLCYVAFLVCIYRVFRYNAQVFATDYCILIPATQFFCTTDGMSLLIWVCLVAAAWYFVCHKIRANGALVCVFLLLNYLLLRMQSDIGNFVLSFGQIFLLYVLVPKQDARSAQRIIKAFCWSLLVTSVYGLVLRKTPQLVEIRGKEAIAIYGLSLTRFSALLKDSNYYMTLLMIGIVSICKLKELGKVSNPMFWAVSLSLALFGVLSYSKTFFLVFFFFASAYILWQFWTKRSLKGLVFSVFGIIAVFLLIFSSNSPFAIVMKRLTSAVDLDQLTTGRSELFTRYWDAITETPLKFLFGHGFNAPLLEKGAHNIYLEMAYYLGIIGLLLMVAFYVALISMITKNNLAVKGQSMVGKYVVIFVAAVLYLSLQGIFQIVTYGGFFVAAISVLITPNTHDNARRKT